MTWVLWLLFWLLLPIILFGIIGFAVAHFWGSISWGVAAFVLVFCCHGFVIWGRLKRATDTIVADRIQASWISSTLASFALITACFIGLAGVSLTSFAAGMNASLFDLSSCDELQQRNTPPSEELPIDEDLGIPADILSTNGEPPAARPLTTTEIHTKNNLAVWWHRGDASMPVVGFDATPIADVSPWHLSDLCRSGMLFIFARSSSDGPVEVNQRLSRERAETLLSILERVVEGCAIGQRPELVAVSLGQSLELWHDGQQRVAKVGLVPRQSNAAKQSVLDRGDLSLIGDGVGIPIVIYEDVEVCLLKEESICDWREIIDYP